MKPLGELKIAIGADHAGFNYKQVLLDAIKTRDIKDFGTYAADSVDYPDFAHPVALAVESGDYDFGILICGSANGVAMTANKHQGIRAGLCWKAEVAAITRMHNNANVLCIPARFVSLDEALDIANTFITTDFEGGRHANRISKIYC